MMGCCNPSSYNAIHSCISSTNCWWLLDILISVDELNVIAFRCVQLFIRYYLLFCSYDSNNMYIQAYIFVCILLSWHFFPRIIFSKYFCGSTHSKIACLPHHWILYNSSLKKFKNSNCLIYLLWKKYKRIIISVFCLI